MPPGVARVHPWSDSDEPQQARQTGLISPADRAAIDVSKQAATIILGLARDGKVNRRGLPSLLQLSVLLAPTMPATCIAGPAAWLQRLLLRTLPHIALALGYRQMSEQYGGLADGQLKLPTQ